MVCMLRVNGAYSAGDLDDRCSCSMKKHEAADRNGRSPSESHFL